MTSLIHKTATATHYNKEAKSYDEMNKKNSAIINQTIFEVLIKHKIKKIADFTCGTGSQVFYLHKKGFDIAGFDINKKMLQIAKRKAKTNKITLQFQQGDIRIIQAGKYDAILSIFNAIGHLTKKDFVKAIHNIDKNLNPGGLYIYDIFNLNYLLDGDNITKLTIDWQRKVDDKTVREIQYSTIDEAGILASCDVYIEKSPGKKAKVSHANQTLQVYSAAELKQIFSECGFKIIKKCNPDGTRFSDKKSERMLIIAKKP